MKGTYQDHSQWIIPFWILILIPQTYSCLKPLLAENQVSLWPILGSFCGKPQANQTEPRNPRSTSTMIGINANWTNLILWCITYISILHGKKRGEQKHINSWKVSDSSPKGYGAPKAMGIFTLVFFSCLKGLLGAWLSSRFVYIYIPEKELTENVGSLMSLSCLSGSFPASWTELPLQCFYLPWKKQCLAELKINLLQSSSTTLMRDVMMSGKTCVPIQYWCWLGIASHKAVSVPWGTRDVWKKPLPLKVVVIKGIAFVSFHVHFAEL